LNRKSFCFFFQKEALAFLIARSRSRDIFSMPSRILGWYAACLAFWKHDMKRARPSPQRSTTDIPSKAALRAEKKSGLYTSTLCPVPKPAPLVRKHRLTQVFKGEVVR
jgi:hypothetical protein